MTKTITLITLAITWKILKRAKSYSNSSKRCNLCILEKYSIICKPDVASLNRCNELRHAKKYLLENFITGHEFFRGTS